MKIALIAANPWGWGGSELLWSQTALRLIQRGMNIGIHMVGWPGTPARILDLKGRCVFIERSPHGQTEGGSGEFEWLDRYRPEMAVVSQGMSYDGLPWMTACLDRKIPYAIIIQAAAEHACPEGVLADALADCFQKARRCYFVSAANIRLVEKQLGVRLDNACLVRNPFNVPYDTKPTWPGTGGHSLNLACVARLDCRPKGQDILLEVLKAPKWKDRPVKVNFYGKGLMRTTLERLADMWELSNVKFCGFVDDVRMVWQDNHALILPSRFEGLPLAVVEAMLCGRLCIVTDAGGNAELIKDNVDGFIAKAPKAELLDEALERAWQRRSDWQQMGKMAASHIKKYVPADPAEVFARELLALCAGGENGDSLSRRNDTVAVVT
jgi:glycosyltransferase involved in cell wall biosynthesis